MTLVEQIRLFKTHTTFIGTWGSAFHNVMFYLEPNRITTHVLGLEFTNYYVFDAITGIQGNYVDCLPRTLGVEQTWPRLDLQIDTELATAYLQRNGTTGTR